MKPKDIKLLPKEPLSPADRRVLEGRFRKRFGSFLAVSATVIVLVVIELGPNTQKIHDAIEDPKLRWAIIGIALALAAAVFYRRVWVYRRDLNAGFKYVNRLLVISKSGAGGNSIDLEDLSYHKLHVDAATWERLQPGDRYPVGFAAHSQYALTRESALG